VSARHRRQRNPFKQNRKLSKITVAMAGVTVIVPAAVAAGLATSGGLGGHGSSLVAIAGSQPGAGPGAVGAGIPMTSAARAAVTSLVARRAYERAADRRTLELLIDRRTAEQAADQQAAAQAAPVQQTSSGTANPAPQPSGSPQHIALAMLGSFGWPASQFGCLQSLWNAESGWNVYASNPNSGAYGIPQALPGSKMASAGPNWQSNAATQIRWGLGYIKGLYGSPCGAWAQERAYGWY
jgi:hypothetical protein